MAEIGIVASVIGVASAGFRLSLVLNAISCEIAQAPLEIHYISKTVTLFSLMLKQTGTVLQAADSVHSREAVEAAKQVADESNRVFDEIKDMLDRVRSKKDDGPMKPTARQRIKWCFKKSRITYLLGQLESLKLSLSLMLQILQLGKMMAATSKYDPPEVVQDKSAVIQQERAEAQNTLIVRYIQIHETEQLFAACNQDEGGPGSPIEYRDDTDNDSQVTIKPPPEYSSSLALAKLPVHSLGEIDELLENMGNSSKDMVRISDQAIDPLLEKWTRWYEVREYRHSRYPQSKYTPTVHSLNEDDLPYYEQYRERDDSPRGYYLEGTTTDWRKPNSNAARQEYAQRRKQYAGYQPSISGHSTDQEDSPASNASGKRTTKRHVINSSSESSDSEAETRNKQRAVKFQPGPPLERSASSQPVSAQSTPPSHQMPSRMPPSPAQSTGSMPSISPQYLPPQNGRPYPVPDQGRQNQGAPMPLPPIYTHNASNPYAPTGHQSSAYNHSPYYVQLRGTNQTRPYSQAPDRMSAPRPLSKDGKGGRSPSRLSQEMPRDKDYEYYQDRDRDRDRYRDREIDRERERDRDRERDREYARRDKRPKESKTKALREGATKGLLGAGAIAGFLEALEGLSI